MTSKSKIDQMKKLTTLFIIIFTCFVADLVQAQLNSVGIIGGYANTGANKYENLHPKYEPEANFVAGLQTSFQLSKKWFLDAEILYRQNGFRIPFVGVNEESDANFSYLAFPLRTSYKIGNKIQGFISVGLTPALLLDAHQVSPLIGLGEEELIGTSIKIDLKDHTRNFDLSGLVAIGGRYNFGKWALSLEGRYNRSFLDFEQSPIKSDYKFYHRSWQVLLGVHYILGKSKK